MHQFISLVTITHTSYNKNFHVTVGSVALDRFSSSEIYCHDSLCVMVGPIAMLPQNNVRCVKSYFHQNMYVAIEPSVIK
jgi:hypothetical protein